MKTTTLRRLGLLVLVLALVAAACGDDDAGDGDTTTTTAADGGEFTPGPLGAVTIESGGAVEIRALQSLSGEVAPLGTDQVRGIELAISDYGDIQGHSVNLGTPEDDGCSAEGGQAGAQAIIAQEGVLGVIGTTCSGAAAAASPLLSAAGMVLISGSNTSPSLSSDLEGTAGENYHPGYYRTAHNDLFQGQTTARFAYEELGVRSVAAIHDGDPYTDGLATAFANAFEELGGTVSVYTAVNKGDTDMTAVLTEVAAGDPAPELVYFPIFQPEGDFIIQQSSGIAGLEDVIWFGADGLLVDSFLELPESEGMYFSGPDLRFGANTGLTGKSYDQLVSDYEAAYGEAPIAVFHAHTYDATMMLLNAIDAVAVVDDDGTMHVDRQALRDELTATMAFSGVTGVLECDDFGDCGAQAISIVLHEDSSDVAAGKSNVVYSFSPTG